MKLYREVKCSDRLPGKLGEYFTEKGRAWFHPLGKYWTINSGKRVPKVWLEPYELPTEEKIEIAWLSVRKLNWPHEYIEDSGCINYDDFKKAIINLLKEE